MNKLVISEIVLFDSSSNKQRATREVADVLSGEYPQILSLQSNE